MDARRQSGPTLLQWPFQLLKEEGLGVCRPSQKTCAGRNFLNVTDHHAHHGFRSPKTLSFAVSKHHVFPRASEHHAHPGVSEVIFGRVSDTMTRSQLGCPPALKHSQTVRQLPKKHRTPTSIPPNRHRRADQAKRGGLVSCSLRRKDQISSAETQLQDKWVDRGTLKSQAMPDRAMQYQKGQHHLWEKQPLKEVPRILEETRLGFVWRPAQTRRTKPCSQEGSLQVKLPLLL